MSQPRGERKLRSVELDLRALRLPIHAVGARPRAKEKASVLDSEYTKVFWPQTT